MTIRRTLPRRPAGFTLMELIVVVTIVGIMAAIAAPSFKDMMVNQRVKSASFDMTAALTLARSEALKQNGSVTLTPSSGTTEWANGWTITGPDAAIIGTQGAYPSITIADIAGATSIVYNRTGRSASTKTVTLQVGSSTSGSADLTRCISVGVTGQPKSVKGSCPLP